MAGADCFDAAIDELVERRFARRATGYFGGVARRVRVVDWSELADLLEDAALQGRISAGDRIEVLRSGLVLTGQRREDGANIYLLTEVSPSIGVDDVRRAVDRAAVLAKLGHPAIPVVAGRRIDPEPAKLAAARGVRQVLDGQP